MTNVKKIKLWLIGFVSFAIFYHTSAQALTANIGTQTNPAHFNYTNTFTNQATSPFTDWWAFTVNTSVFDATTVGIKLSSVFGISGLETRLYKGHITETGEVQSDSLVASGTLINSNKSTINIISPIAISGSYLLGVTGMVTGSNGGSYAGIANIGPASVPAPNILLLLLSGVALMGSFYRKS